MLVYRATNTRNGKVYVGVTQGALARRMREHKSRAATQRTAFAGAIRKWGWSSFAWDVLEVCADADALRAAEQRWIAALDCMVDSGKGYNRTAGGDGSVRAVVKRETRAKLSAAARGRKQSPELVAKRTAALRGRRPSELAVQRSAATRATPEFRARLSALAKARPYRRTPAGHAAIAAGARRRSLEETTTKLKRGYADDVRAALSAGEPLRVIGARYGVTPSAVSYYCKRHGISA